MKNSLKQNSKQSLSLSKILVRYCVIFSLWIFIFHPFIYAQEVDEEDNVIREGPPPLEDPLYLDLGSFVVNMPDDKYFLKSSIQLAFVNSEAKEWWKTGFQLLGI